MASGTPLQTMGIVGLYAIVGTSLTLVNKLVMHRYPHGSALMLLQCSVTVALVALWRGQGGGGWHGRPAQT